VTPAGRVYAAVSGGVPDRVPFVPKIWIDLASNLLGEDLLELAGDPARALEITARAAAELGLDGARLFHLPPRNLVREKDGSVIELDGHGNRLGTVDFQGGLNTHLDNPADFDPFDPGDVAFAQFRTADGPFIRNAAEARAMAVPGRRFWDEFGAVRRTEELVRKYGESLALLGDLGSATLSFCVSFRGMERTMFDLVDDPALVHALMDKGAEIAVERAKFNVDAGIRILRLNDSAGNMNVISPEAWREFVFPRFRDIIAAVKAYEPAARVYCHICGNVLPIAADLAASGLDCIGPLDPLGGSTPARMRALIGGGVALMGGIDTLSFLNGSPESITKEAFECMRTGGAKGGFVLGSGCALPRGTPAANLAAARDAALKYGIYHDGILAERSLS
jgi:uroporphyrinogen-III decarboxylase